MGDSHSTRGFWCVKIETASTELCSPQSGLLYSSKFPRFSKLSFSSATPDLFFLYLSPSCDSTPRLCWFPPHAPCPTPAQRRRESLKKSGGFSSVRSHLPGAGAGPVVGSSSVWAGLPSCREMPSDGLLCLPVKSPISRSPSYDSL